MSLNGHIKNDLFHSIMAIPLGFSEIIYKSKKYAVTRSDFNKGRSLKVYANELGGTDFISFNYYLTSQNNLLKPCEMPEQKVLDFLKSCYQSH